MQVVTSSALCISLVLSTSRSGAKQLQNYGTRAFKFRASYMLKLGVKMSNQGPRYLLVGVGTRIETFSS
jgi:hypothetical protein